MTTFFLKINRYNKTSGFTIIETMVSISIFLIIMTIGMGAFLNANVLHQKSQDTRSIMDSLSFVMEDMSRNLRTGSNYHCDIGMGTLSAPLSCTLGGSIAFTPNNIGTSSGLWMYKIDDSLSTGTIGVLRSTDGGVTWVQLNSSGVVIDSASGFTVIGAEPSTFAGGDTKQPLVIIRLSGKIIYKGTETPFSLQTSVSQRAIDI